LRNPDHELPAQLPFSSSLEFMKSLIDLPLLTAISLMLSMPAMAEPQPAKPQPAKPQPGKPDGPMEVNGIAAKVNGRVVTKNEVSFMLAPIYAQLSAQFPRRGKEFYSKLEEAKKNILQELIDRQIILDEFKQLGASINAHAVDDEIKRQINNLYSGDKSKFNEELKKSRLTMEGYRTMTLEKMIVQAMRQQQFSDAPPPLPNEIQNEYAQMKNMMRNISKDMITFEKIFIPISDPADPAVTRDTQLELAEQIVADLKAGKEFAPLAKAHSKDAFADKGGVQADVPRSDISAEFAAIFFDAKEGDLIGPLVDANGFTIVKPTKITLGPAPALSEIRDMVEERVRKKKTSAQYERWIESRRKRAMVDVKI
jgi:peptidyl-prolyl cis-trans isomerase SurA